MHLKLIRTCIFNIVSIRYKLFNITVIQSVPTTNAKELRVKWFCRPKYDLLELMIKKMSFSSWLEYKSRKSRDTWRREEIGCGKANESGQRLTEAYKRTHSVAANGLFQQHKRQLNKWTSSDITETRLIIFCVAEDGEGVYNQQHKTRCWLWLCDLCAFEHKIRSIEK